jgi:hypothetical protein
MTLVIGKSTKYKFREAHLDKRTSLQWRYLATEGETDPAVSRINATSNQRVRNHRPPNLTQHCYDFIFMKYISVSLIKCS